MWGSRKYCQRGSNSDIFLVDAGREDQNTTKSGPSSSCQRSAIEMAFHWHADDGPTLNADLVGSFVILCGIRTRIAKKPYIFVIFSGGGGPEPLSPPLDLRMSTNDHLITSRTLYIYH